MRENSPSHSGFSLVELSIVLVILGLLVGGILTGQHLIRAAEIRAQMNQIEQFQTATLTFRDKYLALPGDLPNASAFGFGTSAALHNGNGDGTLDNATYAYMTTVYSYHNYFKESANFFLHLAESGMAEGSFVGFTGDGHNTTQTIAMQRERYPESKIGEALVIPTHFGYRNGYDSDKDKHIQGGHGFGIAIIDEDQTNPFMSGNIGWEDAWQIDQKRDDGLPYSGNIVIGSPHPAFAATLVAFKEPKPSYCMGTSYMTIYHATLCPKVKLLFLNLF